MKREITHPEGILWILSVAAVALAPSTRGLDLKADAVILSFLLLLLSAAVRLVRERKVVFSHLEGWLALYLAWSALSILWAPVPLIAVEQVLRVLAFAGIYLLVRQDGTERLETLLRWAWMIAAVLLSFYGVLQMTGFEFVPAYQTSVSMTRVFATFGNAGLFASFLVLSWPVLLLPGWRKGGGATAWRMAGILILLSVLLMTGSRAGMAALVVQAVVGVFLFRDELRTLFAFRWARVAAILSLGILLAVMAGFLSRPTDRLEVWKGSVRMAMEHPWEGWGAGQFSIQYPQYAGATTAALIRSDDTYAEHVHNELLETLVEKGVIGTVLWGLFWSLLALRTFGPGVDRGGRLLVVALAGFGFADLFGYSGRMPGGGFFLWIAAGLAANRLTPRGERMLFRPMAVLVAALMTFTAFAWAHRHLRGMSAQIIVERETTVLPDISGDPVVEEKRVVGAIRQVPRSAELYRRLGNVFLKQGRLEAAEGAYQKAIKLDPTDAGSYLNLGNIYFLMASKNPNKLDSALQIYMMASRMIPGDPEPHYNMAYAYFAQRRMKEALRELDIVLKMDPGHAKALALRRKMLQ